MASASILNTCTKSHWETIGIKHHFGIALPLFSLRTSESAAIGEYLDLIPLIPWCKSIGFDVIQLLPLNDTGNETSPYSAISAFALNPIHLSLSKLPKAIDDPSLYSQLIAMQSKNNTTRVDYKFVQVAKELFLREYYQKYGNEIASGSNYQLFINDNRSWLRSFALFKALTTFYSSQNIAKWSSEHQNPSHTFLTSEHKEFEREMDYHICIQYLCFMQLSQVKNEATMQGMLLKGDIPILINRNSADVWAHPSLFLKEYSAGAPPDQYALNGQNWDTPPYNWENHEHTQFAWWKERLDIASKFYHLYRIDHIVGFFRIWAIQQSHKAKDGHFIPSDESTWIEKGTNILQILIKHSGMLPIGEDLGTVPQEVRETLRSLGVCGTKVCRWERRWQGDLGFIDPKDYIKESMTTVSTHDSESLFIWWKNHPDSAKLYADTFKLAYDEALSLENRLLILRASHTSGSLFHINPLQEYLALLEPMRWDNPLEERINIPGTVSPFNWSYKFRPSLEEIIESKELKSQLYQIMHFQFE